jgi:Ca2+-binding RTX toxin-like protein
MHLVHAKGLEDILPEYHKEIVEAEQAAIEAGIFKYGRPAPHEYIITGFDIYFGLWDHDPQGDRKSFGEEYPYHTKEEMKAGDPALYDLVEKFWPKYLTYNAYIDPSFEGTFSTVRDENTPYTFKSQYLVNIILTGAKNMNILGNDQDNRLTGNDGNNVITGGKGNDVIAGGKGEDTAKFSGNSSEYKITKTENKTIVIDSVSGRDGKDELMDIEVLKFQDQEVKL